MRAGGGKSKGSSFERKVCKQLSLWVTEGKRSDVFWRSAMSGGRATVAHKKGDSVRQSGDISAVAPEGHVLTDKYFIEVKHVRSLGLETLIFRDSGTLLKFWLKAVEQAKNHGKSPVIIARQNHAPTMVITSTDSEFIGGLPCIRLQTGKVSVDMALFSYFKRAPVKKRIRL